MFSRVCWRFSCTMDRSLRHPGRLLGRQAARDLLDRNQAVETQVARPVHGAERARANQRDVGKALLGDVTFREGHM